MAPAILAHKRGREERSSFTLIELLVVVAIVALLAALLLPSLQNAKEKGKTAVCLSQMRQLHTILMLYADDNRGFFPYVLTSTMQTFFTAPGNAGGTPWDLKAAPSSWMGRYLTTQKILLCPGMDPLLSQNNGYLGPGSDPTYVYGIATYRIMASTGWSDYGPYVFYGHYFSAFDSLTEAGTERAPCPNVNFCGRTITGYSPADELGPVYIPPADQAPAVVDAFDPVLGGWYALYYTGPLAANNHGRLKGENVVFVDGHGEWRAASNAQIHFGCANGCGAAVYW